MCSIVSVIQLLPLRADRISAAAGQNAHQGLAVSEYHDADHRIAVQRVFRECSKRARERAARTGPIWFRCRIFRPAVRCAKTISGWARTTRPSSIFRSTFPAERDRIRDVFGTLGRNTFRGPGYHDFDFALIKDTPFGHRGNAEFGTLEFRAEFFNLFNIVNFGLPSNIVRGSGFGIISKTSGTSRQIQFSLKVIY